MATAFLGYDYSPRWYELNLNFSYFNIFSLLFTFSFILFYLDNFNLSDNFLIKFIQVISFVSILFICVLSSDELYTNQDSYLNNIKKEEIFFIATVNIHRYNFSTFQPFYKQLNYSSTLCKNNLLDTLLKKNKLKPVYFYENLHLDKMRKTILEDTKNLSGIYLIFNKITGDYYIGSASTNRFYARFSNHLLYFRGSKIIKHAVKKYGLSNFAFLILELFPFIVNKENNKNLLNMEDYYLKSLLPNYNILTEAGSSFGYKHTEIDRIKMKLNYSIERRERIGKLNRNKKLSLETIEKIRDKALSKNKIFYSDEALLNMKKKSKPVILYNLNNTVFGEYPSIVEAAKSINCDSKTIKRALKTEKKILKRRFIVKYKEYK
jgi:group I intron endonuclease